jgi:hypothetical protein
MADLLWRNGSWEKLVQAFSVAAMWSPMWMTLSAITPRPTHLFMPQSPL